MWDELTEKKKKKKADHARHRTLNVLLSASASQHPDHRRAITLFADVWHYIYLMGRVNYLIPHVNRSTIVPLFVYIRSRGWVRRVTFAVPHGN